MNRTVAPPAIKFDAKMYQAALAYYGLPANYSRVFKVVPATDPETHKPLFKADGTPETWLRSCNASGESQRGNSVWVQVNLPHEPAAKNAKGYPKKAKNEDIAHLANITLDCEYPPEPARALRIGEALAIYLVEIGLAEPGLPVENSGAGPHIGLPLPAIEVTKETAERWNEAVRAVVKQYILPEFSRLCEREQVKMDLSGFDISRVLSLPGTWRPTNPAKADCETLKQGHLRCWLPPYTNGKYPVRKECARLATLIQEEYAKLEANQLPLSEPHRKPAQDSTAPAQWLDNYAAQHPNNDRSGHFQSLVNATCLQYGEDMVETLKQDISRLSGEKYNGRLDDEIARSLAKARSDIHIPTRATNGNGRSGAAPTDNELQTLVSDAIKKQDVQVIYDLAEKISTLDTRPQELLKSSIKMGMQQAPGWSWSGFKKLLAEARKKQQQATRKEQSKSSKQDEIILGQQLDEEVDAILEALYKNNDPPVLFVRSGSLVRYCINEKQQPSIETINEHMMLDRIARTARFFTHSEKDDSYKNAHPTPKHARQILAQGSWKVPALEGITEVPIIRKDGIGTILEKEGYDEQSRLLYLPQWGLEIPAIPTHPNREQVEQARDFAFGFISEFPYVSPADRANAYGLMLTVVTRILYALAPLALLNATKPGTGKTLLFKVIAMLLTGRIVGTTTMPADEEEWGKTLTGLLLEGTVSAFCIDNIEHTLNSGKFASFLTNTRWKDRVLGSNAMPELEQHTIPMATGNNLMLGGDIPRRCYRITMDAGMSTPWQRDTFTYVPLIEHIQKNRGKIIAALLTMVRAWYVAGQPKPEKKVAFQDDFGEWARITSGVLSFVGIEGFLANSDSFFEEADIEGTAWAIWLEKWYEQYPTQEMTTAEIKKELDAYPEEFAAFLPDDLRGLYQAQDKKFNQILGLQLRKRKNTPFGKLNLRLMNGKEDSHAKVATWRIVAGTCGEFSKVPATGNDVPDTLPNGSTSDARPLLHKQENTTFAGSAESDSTPVRKQNNFFLKEEEICHQKKNIYSNGNGPDKSPHSPQAENSNTTPNGSTSDARPLLGVAGSSQKSPQVPASPPPLHEGMRVTTPAGPGSVSGVSIGQSGILNQVTVRLDSTGNVKTFWKDEEIGQIVEEVEENA